MYADVPLQALRDQARWKSGDCEVEEAAARRFDVPTAVALNWPWMDRPSQHPVRAFRYS
jgi:hypothetical protein